MFLGLLGYPRKYRWSYCTFWIVGVVVAIIGSKPGAGNHHFMLLLPVILWLSAQIYFDMSAEDKKKISFVVAASLLTLSINALNRQKE